MINGIDPNISITANNVDNTTKNPMNENSIII
jgi:hypothetical protein